MLLAVNKSEAMDNYQRFFQGNGPKNLEGL